MPIKYFNLSLLLICLFLVVCSTKRVSEENDIYNLGFERSLNFTEPNNSWKVAGCWHQLKQDSLNVKFGRSSTEVRVSTSPFPEARSLSIFQAIYLPIVTKKLSLSLWIKSENFGAAYFKASLLDSNENNVTSDSVTFKHSSEWEKYTLNIEGKSGEILFLEINIGQNSKIWLDELEIKLKDKDLYKYFPTKNDSNNKPEIAQFGNAVSIKMIDTVKNEILKELIGKRIIGIGESVHGQHEMAETRNQIIKYLVKNSNCKLIVLEAPDLFVESLNEYIQGSLKETDIFKPENIPNAQFFIYSEEVLQLLKWLRAYNETAVKKVLIGGMDVSNLCKKQLDKRLYSYGKDSVVKAIIKSMNSGNSDSLTNMVAHNKTYLLHHLMTINQYDTIYQLTKKFYQYNLAYRSVFNNKDRDSIMAENVKQLVSEHTNKNEKTVICGHLDHLNKLNLSNSLTPSVGRWLLKEYKENYFVIAQLVGNGYYQAYQINPNSLNIHPLFPPVPGSIEEILNQIPLQSFYLHIETLPFFKDKLLQFRSVGGIPHNNQFYSGNLHNRIDAITFSKQGTPLMFFQSKLKEFYKINQKHVDN